MRILVASDHRYPAETGQGNGLRTHPQPSGAPSRVHDWLVKGLAELGHDVFYLLEKGAEAPLPPGVTLVTEPIQEVDIFHNTVSSLKPWVHTQHRFADDLSGAPPANWIFVSSSLARSHGSDRFVLNGIDPHNYLYSAHKEDYFLFLAAMQGRRLHHMYFNKGLDIALSLSQTAGVPLVVAGTTINTATFEHVQHMCRTHGATYVGDVRGSRKAELLAGARALIFPTRLNEGCPLVIAEALMSGTPVISSDKGPCPELISAEVGFVCANQHEYLHAIHHVDTIAPQACRDKALRDHHYLKMAADYVQEYEREIGSHHHAPPIYSTGYASDNRITSINR
ncbi:glycosyltransferase [Candidatus Entotheonella palauensis]|uniref:Glycosyl transferase family 1 domain-containing protein n=1 Tax=Candidatus Entotheonella gemina TaxID=1429439 RepID=W4M120_9BACT|nr:glycosyltransferase [Candidatus Entotheonella palauensis]ETX03813.1 MAG: hypothetical protein ETSY2_32425 [Candidatus Entotheonella gemina]